jgi:hypothetical protein
MLYCYNHKKQNTTHFCSINTITGFNEKAILIMKASFCVTEFYEAIAMAARSNA